MAADQGDCWMVPGGCGPSARAVVPAASTFLGAGDGLRAVPTSECAALQGPRSPQPCRAGWQMATMHHDAGESSLPLLAGTSQQQGAQMAQQGETARHLLHHFMQKCGLCAFLGARGTALSFRGK